MHCRKPEFSLLASGCNKKGGVNYMKITISSDLIERMETEEDGYFVSRIPGKKNMFLYLKKEDIIAQDEYTVLCEINEKNPYLVGSREGDNMVLWNGSKLLEKYQYEATFDPQIRAEKQSSGQNIQVKAEKQSQQIQVEQQRQRTYSKEQFRQLKLGEKHHVDITKIWNIELNAEQMEQLRLMLEAGVPVAELKYNNPSISAEVMSELRLCNRLGNDINDINWHKMNAEQLKQVRLGMEHNIDIKQYAFPAYTGEQMKEMRLALQSGFDISAYRNPHFTEKQMYSIRCQQIWQKIKEELKILWHNFVNHLHLEDLNKLRLNVMQRIERGLSLATDQVLNTPDMRMANHPELVGTLDARINETIQDIKELLVAQELVSEAVMTDDKLSQQFEERIRRTLDELQQPDAIQNPDKQNEIINKSAEALIQEAGAKLPTEEELQEEMEGLINGVEFALDNGIEVLPEEMAAYKKATAAEKVMNAENVDKMMSDKALMDKLGEEMSAEVNLQTNVPPMEPEL